jgi:hypothetical protein
MTSRPADQEELEERCAPLKHTDAGNIEVRCAETLKPVSDINHFALSSCKRTSGLQISQGSGQ